MANKLNKQPVKQKSLTTKKATAKTQPFARYKKGEQLPLFPLPPATANPAITRKLYELQKHLDDMGIQTENYDELYEAAISIIRFTSAVEKRAIEQSQQKSEVQNG